jgi:hypothetical protein
LARSRDGNAAGVGPQSAVVEFGELTDTAANVRADGKRPQHAPLAELNISAAPNGLEVLDVLLSGPCEEKQLVEVTLPGQLCFSERQICVLGQLPRWERSQRHDRYPSLGGEALQSFCGCRLLLGYWKASESPKADSGYTARLRSGRVGPQVKIVFRKENAAAIFGDERVGVSQLAARFI